MRVMTVCCAWDRNFRKTQSPTSKDWFVLLRSAWDFILLWAQRRWCCSCCKASSRSINSSCTTSTLVLPMRKQVGIGGRIIHCLKGGGPRRDMERGVVPVLGLWHPQHPQFGLISDKTTKESLKTVINYLRLPILLRMISSAHLQLTILQLE